MLTLPQEAPKLAATYEYAVKVDVNTPVTDFHRRIPQMAYKVNTEIHSVIIVTILL